MANRAKWLGQAEKIIAIKLQRKLDTISIHTLSGPLSLATQSTEDCKSNKIEHRRTLSKERNSPTPFTLTADLFIGITNLAEVLKV